MLVVGAMTSSTLSLLALQNTPQREGGGLGLSLEIIAASVIACALLTATFFLLYRVKKRRDGLVLRERQAREQMQELCPDGWTARIVLYGDGAPLPDDVPPPGDRNVCVEWTEFESSPTGHTRVAVARRMWATTISGALRGMLADRRLDFELEQIERIVIDDGETGPPAAGHGADR
jgi:hypothetical protein